MNLGIPALCGPSILRGMKVNYEEELSKAENQLEAAVAQHKKIIENATTNHAEPKLKKWYSERSALTQEKIDDVLTRVMALKRLIERTTNNEK